MQPSTRVWQNFLVSIVGIVNDPGCRLSHGRPPMWIQLQDHPASVLKHMALIDRNEAGISTVHVPTYTVADSESALPPPLWVTDRRHHGTPDK